MKNKTNAWKIAGIILLIIVSVLLIISNLGLQDIIEEWNDLYYDSAEDWCEYSNSLITYSNSISAYDTNLILNNCWEWL